MAMAVVAIVAASIVYLHPTFTSKPAAKAGPINAIDRFISSAAQHQAFSGTVLIAQNGKILLDKGYGWADQGQRQLNKPSTRFRIGSITTQFTAMAILLLQEQGKLRVQDPICLYINDCPATWKAITIQHLLTHTSGIPDYATTFPAHQPTSPAQQIAAFESKPLDFAPGAKWNYSNSGYVILGSIIDKVSGESYSGFLQQEIFQVLHLSNTGYDQNFPSPSNHATGYTRPWVKADYVDMKFASGESVQQMFTPQVTACDGQGTLCAASDCEAQRINCYSYGYGWFLGQIPAGGPYVRANWHSGGIQGFVSVNLYYPDQEITLIVLSNLESFNWTLITQDVQTAFIQQLVEAFLVPSPA